MKLGFFELEPWEKDYVKKELRNHKLIFIDDELSNKNVSKVKDVEGLVIFIYSEINEEILNKLPKLKFICTMSTGFDHIDIKSCKELGIRVSNVPTYGENTVAEHTIGLILSLSKKIPYGIMRTRKENFDLEGLEGFDLKNKTLGVIGAGNIGQYVIKIAKALEMKVIVHTHTKRPKLAKKLGFKYSSLKGLLKNSDVVTLHCPFTPQTKHMINMKNIKQMKKGSYIVNTARGGLIDTKALIYALDKEILAGAALDVLEGEDDLKEQHHLKGKKFTKSERKVLLRNHKLLRDRDVLITPHTAFYTREALQRILNTTINNVKFKGARNRVV